MMRLLLPLLFCLSAVLLPKPRLGDDHRIGIVADLQGTALLRPAGRTRWTPLARRSRLMPGDQVRTSARGANAIEIRLGSGSSLIAGPGSLLELSGKQSIRLYRGEFEVEAQGERIAIRGPGGYTEEHAGKVLLRAGKRTEVLAKEPRWLEGYRSSTTDEWMGSLIAKVDGRDVPLSVGYHKVSVDIRDQIARTTVEESFVNSTRSPLEGVFYFPLPPDASISGFGMWIGDELVEADIVEKQRARAIYEDILRRRQDPGLLEWSGGNLFKARVFPILPHSEKRIRIRYTQVLPLSGDRLVYRYGLRSELLRQRPLRQLSLRATVSSTMPIQGVESPSHEVRVRRTKQAAVVEFDAEEYSPEKDFELAVRLDRNRALTAVSHRRGDDGYFMLLLSPPDPSSGSWQRELLAESGPLELVLLADTSGSMDEESREAQADFVAGILSLLGEKDRFRLLTCDVETRAFRDEASPVNDDTRAAALEFLEERVSLGWTDLDRAFEETLSQAGRGAVVVYVGDGIGTTGDADPVALAQRLSLLARGSQVTCHAVSTSSSYERGVLESIASIGGGSVRATRDRPTRAAYRLLAEAAQAPVKDLRISFEGLRTARVYPERLPNLPAGRQQVVLGRYLPEATAQQGKVVVTGTLDGKPVRYATELTLPAKDAGNSFLPRLWARLHVEALLAEGRSPAIQEDIVAFSQEYGIMTPYTSFLVLESDQDRARYGVERRVRMRDGERFFAEGREQADTEIRRQQMKLARAWRLRLEARMLREISRLGKDLSAWTVGYSHGWKAPKTMLNAPFADLDSRLAREIGAASETRERDGLERLAEGKRQNDANEADALEELAESSEEPAKEIQADTPAPITLGLVKDEARAFRSKKAAGKGDYAFERIGRMGGLSGSRSRRMPYSPWSFATLLFPSLAEVPPAPQKLPAPDWPEEVLKLLDSLDRRRVIAASRDGLELSLRRETPHTLRGKPLHVAETLALISARSWFLGQSWSGGQRMEHWADGSTRGVVASGFRLGRRREASAEDRSGWSLPVTDYSLRSLSRSYRPYRASITKRDGDLVVVRLENESRHALELGIDRARKVVLWSRTWSASQLQGTSEYSDFVQAGGLWWASKVEIFGPERRLTSRSVIRVRAVSPAEHAAALRERLAGYRDVVFLAGKDPELGAAKQAIHEHRAVLADQLRVVLHWAATQQWDRVWKAFEKAEELMAGKPGALWLRTVILAWSRRGEELTRHAMELASELAASETATVFLAEWLLNTSSGYLQANESLRLQETLRPVYSGSELLWLRRQAGLLAQAGRAPEALELWRRIALEHPYDHQGLLACVAALIGAGDAGEAQALCRKALARKDYWSEHERNQIYTRWTQSLWNQRLLGELGKVLATWIAEAPLTEFPYSAWLSVLLYQGKEDQADAWIRSTFREQIRTNDRAQIARIGAAIQLALGQGWNIYSYQLDGKWEKPLADLALRLAQTEGASLHLASRILGHHQFQRTDASRELRQRLTVDLAESIATMPPPRLVLYLGWIRWNRNAVDQSLWRSVTGQLGQRWLAASEAEETVLAGQLLRLLDQHGETAEAIAFLRQRMKHAADAVRPGVAAQLLDRLEREPWTAELETELFGLIQELHAPGATEELESATAARAIRRLADALTRMRFEQRMGDEREKLSRAALARKWREVRRSVRRELAASFDRAQSRGAEWERPWYEIERLTLLAELGEEPAKVEAETRELLLGKLQAKQESPSAGLLRARCAVILAYLATRRRAPEGLPERVLALYEESRKKAPEFLDWRYQTFRLLVALDRPEQLARELRTWIVPSKVESRWRIALGYLLAETGKLDAAVKEFEAVAAIDELGPTQYEVLASWYLVLGEQARREKALLARYEAMQDYALASRLDRDAAALSRSRPSQHGNVPRDLDPDTLRVIRVLLRKASQPQHHLHRVKNLYLMVKDFRLLESLADGILGHSPQQVYPFLEQTGSLIGMIHEEATADRLVKRIRELTGKAAKPVDRRALRLLEAQVERRASEVLNAPGPHVERALVALRAAFAGTWLQGERRLMAQYLASLGKITRKELAAEQLRQLRRLHELEPRGSLDCLRIARDRYESEWGYGFFDAAVDGLEAALRVYREARGLLGAEAREELGTLIAWLERRQRFARAEAFLLGELGAESHLRRQLDWLTQRLFAVYVSCLARRGSVSLGRGETLYRNARARMRKALFEGGQDQVYPVLGIFVSLHQTAQKNAGIGRAGAELERFAGGELFELTTYDPSNAQNMFREVANALWQLGGPISGLRLLIRRIETEPRWLRRAGRGGWQAFASSLARWRGEARGIGSLEPRLLAIVLDELERDLSSLRATNRAIYQIRSSYFWAAKKPDFTRAALDFIRRNSASPARVLHAAGYLWSGLSLRDAAIRTLLDAESRGKLLEEGRSSLVSWLHHERRFAESLPVLEKLIAHRPDKMAHRVPMIRALHEVRRDAEATALVDASEEHFKKLARWQETAISALASISLDCRFFERSVRYYEELIPLHQRTHSRRGIGNGTLSHYYARLSQAYIGRGMVDKAVDASAAAVVSWGTSHGNRAHALDALRAVLRQIPDLDTFVRRWDARVEESGGMDAPLIRKMIGLVYGEKKRPRTAIAQLLIARELMPDDREIHDGLIRAYDQLGDGPGACGALLAAISASPMDLGLHADLARRYAALGDRSSAERAWTNLVEIQPNEAESHRLLAAHRESQKRYGEAVVHWRQVVRVRTAEPAGWLSLASAQLSAGRPREARRTLEHVLTTSWEERFGNVRKQASRILSRLKAHPPR